MVEQTDSLYTHALNHFKQGEFSKSLDYFNQGLKSNFDNPWYVHDRARTMLGLNTAQSVSQAVKDLEKIRQSFPYDAQINTSLALAYGRSGDFQRCLTYYKLAQKLDPKNYEAALIGDLSSDNKNHADLLHKKGLDEWNKGNFTEALRFIEAGIAINADNNTWLIHDRARILLLVGDEKTAQKALVDLEKTHQSYPADPQLTVSLAIAYGRVGNYSQCQNYYEKTAELDPKNYELNLINPKEGTHQEVAHRLHDRGIDEMQKGNFQEALRYYEAAVAFGGDQQSAWSIHDRGIALMKLGRYEEALKALQWARELLPVSSIVDIDIVNLYDQLIKNCRGTKGSAPLPFNYIKVLYLQSALLKDPNNQKIQNELNKLGALGIGKIEYHPYQKKVDNNKTSWVDESGNPVLRDVKKERVAIQKYLDQIRLLDPDYYVSLMTQVSSPKMLPMSDSCRVVVNIPAWQEGKNIYGLLENYVKQEDKLGNPLSPDIYEINLIINRKTGMPEDESVSEIERFIKDTKGKYKINYVNCEFDPPFNNVGHARKVITDLTLMRSLQRMHQAGPLYIESEDADLVQTDKHTVINVLTKLDQEPYLDAVRGTQDRYPEVLKENDYLLLQKRIWDFAEVYLRTKKFRPEYNANWNRVWNRTVTGGWNTAYTAQAYAEVDGYRNLSKGEDMDLGMRFTWMRGNKDKENLDVIGRVASRSSSSPRRSIEEVASEQAAYGDSFEDPAANEKLKNATLPELLQKIKHVARIDSSNSLIFHRLIANYLDFYRLVTPNEAESKKMMEHVLFWLGFQKKDYVINPEGKLIINDWSNFKNALEGYRRRFTPRLATENRYL